MSSTVQKIKERLPIIDVIGSYIDVEKSGTSFKAKCPFHSEKTPSFFISPDRSNYYCFGCGVKGDIFTFVEEFEGVDFVTALKLLADRAGVTIDRAEKVDNTEERLYDCIEEATKFFQVKLKDEKDALVYLKNRSLAIETLRDWRLGFALSEWRTLKAHLKAKGFSEREMLDAGLIKESAKETNNAGESYDRFRGRIMFPIFDSAGRVIAFSGRVLSKDEEPKYLNSPDTQLFDKSKSLYGYHVAKYKMREKGFVILVEGQMDLLMSHQAGFDNTVASSGTALSVNHLIILKRLVPTIVLAYDADNAGRNATFRAWKLALVKGFEVKIALLPNGLDPADAIAKDRTLWQDAVVGAKHIVDYFLESMKEEKNTKTADTILKEKVLPLIKAVESSIDQSRFIQKASFVSGITENALITELSKIKEDDAEPEIKVELKKKPFDHKYRTIGFLLWLRSTGNVYAKDFEEKLSIIFPDFKSIIPTDEVEQSALLFSAEMNFLGETNLLLVGNKLLLHFEEEDLKIQFANAMERLKKSEAVQDKETVDKELAICQEISLKLSTLSIKYMESS